MIIARWPPTHPKRHPSHMTAHYTTVTLQYTAVDAIIESTLRGGFRTVAAAQTRTMRLEQMSAKHRHTLKNT